MMRLLTTAALKCSTATLCFLLLLGGTTLLTTTAHAASTHPARAQRPLVVLYGTNSAFGPSAAVSGQLVVAWTEGPASGTSQGHLAIDLVGSPWMTLTDTSYAAPGIAAFNGSIYIAWRAHDSSNSIHVAHYDGTPQLKGGNVVTINGVVQTTYAAPALGVLGNTLYVAWSGTDSSRHLNIAQSTDGQHWGSKQTLNSSSSTGATLNPYNNHLYVAFHGTDDHLWIGYYTGSATLANYACLSISGTCSEKTTVGVGLTNNGIFGELIIAWTGTDNHLNWAYSSDGQHFGNKMTDSSNTSYNALSLAFDGGINATVNLFWTGTDTQVNYETIPTN